MTEELPCRSNPDQWFLEKDEDPKARREAKDLCFTKCPLRLQCLDIGLREGQAHGIWGGYYPEELRKLRRTAAKRGISFPDDTPRPGGLLR